MQVEAASALRELEASVLGAVLHNNATLAQFPQLEVADFQHAGHRHVFAAMRNLETANRPIDTVTVEAELVRAQVENLDRGFLGMLMLRVPTVDNAIEYVRQIRDAAIGRRIRLALGDVLARADELSGGDLLSLTFALLSKIDEAQPDSTVPIEDLVRRRFKELEQIAADRANGLHKLTGYTTGVAKLDEKIGGWQPGIVSIVAARPGHGKSSLGLATADANTAADIGVHLFSLEDPWRALSDRAVARRSGVSAERMRNVDLTRDDCSRIARAHTELKGRRWRVDDRSGITADEIIRTVRRHKRDNKTRVVLVDYIQLVAHDRRGGRMSTHEVLTENITKLADAAKHDEIAYVVMSQLNRELERRQDKRPLMSDLRESGSLEERAKCVVGLYRGSCYGEPTEGVDWSPGWDACPTRPNPHAFAHMVQLCVLKNSNGQIGTVLAHWDGPTTTIS